MSTRYVRLPTFIQIINVLDLHFQGQRFESITLVSSQVIISKTVTDGTNIAISDTESDMWPLERHIYIWPCPILKVKVKIIHFRLRISRKRWQIVQTLLAPTNIKSKTAFALTYLRLTLAHFKLEDQSHAHFNWLYLANRDEIWKTLLVTTNRKSHVAFD